MQPTSSDDDFETALASLMVARERDRDVDPGRWIERYPAHASRLRSFLAAERMLRGEPARSADLSGTVVDDFQLVAPIARGGMGVVYHAIQLSLQRPVAVKLIADGLLADPAVRQRFRIEAETAATLAHPNLLPIHCVGCWRGVDYFAMPLVGGGSPGSIADWVRCRAEELTTGRADCRGPRRSIEALRAIAGGIAHAHAAGIVHRDLKPDNVLIDDDGTPKVVDFGLAKTLTTAGSITRADLTADGQILGTPHYMSPEQARGVESITAATDIYSLGGMLYSLLTGEPPHDGRSAAEVVLAVASDDRPSLRTRLASTQLGTLRLTDLEAILARAMAASPRDRYATASDFADDLGRVLRGDRPEATEDGLVGRVSRELTRDQHNASFDGWSRPLYQIGGIVLAAHLAMFALGETTVPALVRFLPRIAMLAAIGGVIYRSRGGHWMPRTVAERPVWSIWGGYVAVLFFVNAARLLELIDDPWVFVIASLCSGMAFTSMAGHLWGGNAVLGGGFFMIAALCLAFPPAAPLLVGVGWAASMFVLGRHYQAKLPAAGLGQPDRSGTIQPIETIASAGMTGPGANLGPSPDRSV